MFVSRKYVFDDKKFIRVRKMFQKDYNKHIFLNLVVMVIQSN